MFAVRGVTVALGKPSAGQVTHDPVASRRRAAVILAAGSLANLAAAGVLLALGLAAGPAKIGAVQVPVHQAVEVSLGLAYEVVLLPGMPPHAVNLAVGRLQWVIDAHNSAAARNGHQDGAAVLHSMAVARLRQGNPGVVEQLCREVMASRELSPGERATVLATVALARRALGQPYGTLLAEATALDPEADLVAEASRRPAAAGTRRPWPPPAVVSLCLKAGGLDHRGQAGLVAAPGRDQQLTAACSTSKPRTSASPARAAPLLAGPHSASSSHAPSGEAT